MTQHRRLLAAAATLAVALTAAPAHAVANPAPAASADAYALLVGATLVSGNVPLNVGPIARATQDDPPGAADPAEAQVLNAGPVPADSSVVDHAGVMTSFAGADRTTPLAVAASQTLDVALLGAGNNAIVTADAVTAVANADCDTAPNAAGTEFANVVVNGVKQSNTPAPNTRILIPSVNPILVVILNEQQIAADGRGIVVNAIHVVSTGSGDAIFHGDVIVSHAAATVACTNGAGSTGGSTVIQMTKSAAPATAKPGDTVTYSAAVTNKSTSTCNVNAFIEHLSPVFDLVSTTGDFGTALDKTVARPGGGADLYLGKGKTIAANATLHQTFVVKVKDGAASGTYYNNLELLCADQGDFIKGLDAPVTVTNGVVPKPKPQPKPQCSDGKDNDGDGKVDFPKDPGCTSALDDDERDVMPRTGGNDALLTLGGALLLGAAYATRRVRASLG